MSQHILFLNILAHHILRICATLCVIFSVKSKATNVFPKYILKSKARNKSIQVMKKLYCHLTVNNYLCNVLRKFLIKIESTCGREIKEQAPQLTLLYCGRTVRSSHRRCSIKKMFLKISLYPQETSLRESLFKRVAGLKACIFIKKKLQHRWFPVNISKFLRLSVSKNICNQLPWIVSMVRCYMCLKVQGLNCTMVSGFRIQVTDLAFCF